MSIRGSNFENQHPFASDHALVWAHCMPDGLLYGVDMSFTPTLFTLGTGFMLVAGRMFEITTAENISINPGNGYARVYATIDTGGTASENSFDQVSFGVDYAANLDSFPELTQGEININQGAAVYQAEVAVLAINNTGVTTIERQMELVEAGAGGGSGSAFAAIAVSYPPGSICTCTDGIKTFTAKDTSGQVLFIIPYAATWTVTATNGTDTKSETVEISAEGQLESVKLSYRLYIVKDGVDITEVTGGWEVLEQGNSTPTFGTENGAFYFKPTYGGGVAKIATSKSVDFSAYSTLYFDAQSASSEYATGAVHNALNDGSNNIVGSVSMNPTRTTVSIPLDAITPRNALYVVLGDRSLSGVVYIYNIWAE